MNQQQVKQLAEDFAKICKDKVGKQLTSSINPAGPVKAILPVILAALLAGATPNKGEWWDEST